MNDAEKKIDRIVRTYAERAWRLARTWLKDPVEAEDAVQETFLLAVRHIDQLGEEPWPWLAATVVNQCRNMMRRRKSRKAKELPMDAIDPASADPARIAALAEETRLLTEAVDSLPDEEREAVLLVHLSGLSHRQAAEALSCPASTLGVRVRRGVETLQKKLREPEGVCTAAMGIMAVPPPPRGWDGAVEAWSLAARSAASGTAVVTGLTVGGVIMGKKTLFVLAVCLAFLVPAGVFIGMDILETLNAQEEALALSSAPAPSPEANTGKTGAQAPALPNRKDGQETAEEVSAPPPPQSPKGLCLLEGRIVFPPGEAGPASLRVDVVRPDRKPIRDSGSRHFDTAWVKRAQGFRFSFDKLLPSTYHVKAGRVTGRLEGKLVLTLDEPRETVVVKMSPHDPLKYVRVLALDPEGLALREKVGIETFYLSNRGQSSWSYATTSLMSDGSFLVALRDELLPGGIGTFYGIRVTSAAHGSLHIYQPAHGPKREFFARFQKPAQVTVKLKDYIGHPLHRKISLRLNQRRPALTIESSGSSLRDGRKVWPTNEGIQVIGPVQPGPYVLVVRVNTNHRNLPALRIPLELESGSRTVPVTLPKVHALEVHAPKELPGKYVRLFRLDSTGNEMAIKRSPAGRVEFKTIPEGVYGLSVGFAIMRVTVDRFQSVHFEDRGVHGLRVQITYPQGRLPDAGFLDQDLIVEMNGVSLTGYLEVLRSLKALRKAKKADLVVLRQGRRVSLTVSPNALQGREGLLGGRLFVDPK